MEAATVFCLAKELTAEEKFQVEIRVYTRISIAT
jgi:hypothetical protein